MIQDLLFISPYTYIQVLSLVPRTVVRPRPEANPCLAIHWARTIWYRPLTRPLLRDLAAHGPVPHKRLPVLRRLHATQHRHERLRGGRHHAKVHAAVPADPTRRH